MLTTPPSDLLLPGYWVDPVSGAWCSIPWPTDPDEKLELVTQSLGPQIIDWSEGRTDEPGLIHYMTGEPWRWTPGQKRFLILWYHVQPDGRFTYRSGVKRGAKGTGKDPMAGGMCNTELRGPVELYDWDDKTGRPVGRPRGFPLVQVMSNSEAQSRDVLRVANAMWSQEAREFYDLDCGETRTVLRSNGGRFEIPPASEASGEGDPATFVALNESHHMTRESGGTRVAAMGRRNVAKSPASIQARLCEFTNAHRQGNLSVAEASFDAWQVQQSPRYKGKRDILYDTIEAPPGTDILTADGRMAGLEAAYSDSPWSDLPRLSDEMVDSRTSVADTIRFYLNGLGAEEDAWVDPRRFDAMADATKVVADGDRVAMFLDCSKSSDATGLVACRLEDMHVFTLGVWQKPHGEQGKGWLAPREEVDAVGRAAQARYDVAWCGIDPSPATDDDQETLYWRDLIDGWHRDFAKSLPVWATPGRPGSGGGNSVLFDMRLSQPGGSDRNRLFTEMAMATAHDIDEEDKPWTHDGDSTLRVHTHNARRRTNQWGVSLGKVTRDSSKLVDLAVCMVGARLGARLALNSGKLKSKREKTNRAVFL